jgi:DNA mismatch repair protein MutS2
MPEIQLLGMTVDEAIPALDRYIDDCVLSNIGTVRIVHGKGTGALRSAVTMHLKSDKRVSSFRLGTYGEGEDGVTIAQL